MNQRELSLPGLTKTPDEAFNEFPSTRYQGSKRKLLPFLHEACKAYSFSSVIDLYSGTSSVGLMFRRMGKIVSANDYLLYNWTTGKVLLGADNDWLDQLNFPALVEKVFSLRADRGSLVSENFEGIYFPSAENEQIDQFCSNLKEFSKREADLLIYLMGQAMLMKRPYNLFHRANLEMRTKDVPRSFGNAKTWETSFQKHMIKLGRNLAKCEFVGPKGNAYSAHFMLFTQEHRVNLIRTRYFARLRKVV
jgi:adenine-specific DNA-methyltransferase